MNHHLNQNEQFTTKLTLLQEILDKKQNALAAILAISENQEQLYLSPADDVRREFLMEMGKEKQKQIDEVLTCDEVFQRLFDSLANEFAQKGKQYADEVKKLQTSIKDVLELDVQIRAQEQKSRMRARESFGLPAKENVINTTSTNYILDKYQRNNKPSRRGKTP